MIKEFRIAYVLLSDDDWAKLLEACDELGYDKSSIVKNALQGFFKRYRDFYVNAGLADAEARGISSSQHFMILRDKAEEDLPQYIKALPLFGQSPIDTIPPLPQDEKLRRKYNTIKLSAFNYVLLRVAHLVHRDSYPQMVGRMVRSHLQDNWVDAYLPQIERDKQNDYILRS